MAAMENQQQATWGGRFSEGPADLMLRFSESVSFDARLAPFDILVNKAHSAMLRHIGILTEEERDAIHRGLDQVAAKIERGEMEWDAKLEDVHMNIEQELTKLAPAAAKLHTARSRNDQVATDMRLFFKWACGQIDGALREVMAVLLKQADANRDVLIPGYTHLQRAQPVSVAHHLLACVEMFARDRRRFLQVREAANVCPLGSGAIAGTTIPIDREFTARELGFVDDAGHPKVTRNSMDAVADRDVFLEFASACALCGLHFSRVAEDMILWMSQEFRFADLPDAFCTGSSLMPQKKNPDAMELLRGKAARLQGNLQTLAVMVKGLPFTYNRDLQEDKPPVFDSFDQTLLSLQVLGQTLDGLKLRREVCARAVADPLLLATDLADWLVLEGVPFREAHHIVGRMVKLAEDSGRPIHEIPADEASRIHPALGGDWTGVFKLDQAMARRNGPGMPGPERIDAEIARWRGELSAASN